MSSKPWASQCHVRVNIAGFSPVELDVSQNLPLEALKDLVLSQVSIPLSNKEDYKLAINASSVLKVEFVRLNQADPSIKESIKAKRAVELFLFHRPLLGTIDTNINLSSVSSKSPLTSPRSSSKSISTSKHKSSSSSEQVNTSKPKTMTSPRQKITSKISALAGFFGTIGGSPSRSTRYTQSLQSPTSHNRDTKPADTVSGAIPSSNKEIIVGSGKMAHMHLQGQVTVEEIPIVESLHSLDNLVDGNETETVETEHVEFLEIEPALTSLSSVGAPLPDEFVTTDIDLSRTSLTLDGDTVVVLDKLTEPPSVSRYYFRSSHRLSNIPTQTNGNRNTEEENSEIMSNFYAALQQTPKNQNRVLMPENILIVSGAPQLHTIPEAAEEPSMNGLVIESPRLVSVTSSLHSMIEIGKVVRCQMPKPALTANDTLSHFRLMSGKMKTHIQSTGERILDWIASPSTIGRFLRPERKFKAVILPAGPQLIKSDMEQARYQYTCEDTDSPASLMQKVLMIPPEACNAYVLRICGTSEYLIDNDRPFVDYQRLRLIIRSRKRIDLLCEDKCGSRTSMALLHHYKALRAESVPSPLQEPFYGLTTAEYNTCDFSLLDGQVSVKVQALEYLNYDMLARYLDSNDWALRAQFEKGAGLAGTTMSFIIELEILYNNEVIGEVVRTSMKPSPMWVEPLKFNSLNWSNLPRESRLHVKLIFKKTKTSRGVQLGHTFINMFDQFGVLLAGKISIPIILGSETSQPHFVSATSPVPASYKVTTNPVLHYEIPEVKPGVYTIHGLAPWRTVTKKRYNAKPLELLIPDLTDSTEISRLLRIHPMYKLNPSEKAMIWKYRYFLRLSSPHSLSILAKTISWTDLKQIEELHRIVSEWPSFDPLIVLELLDFNVSDTVLRSFAVGCLKLASDEEIVEYMLQLVQALIFEPYHDSALARFLLERALRNRTFVGAAFYWHLVSVAERDSERIAILVECYLNHSGVEHASRIASQSKILAVFRELSARASKLDPKAKLALLETELDADLIDSNTSSYFGTPLAFNNQTIATEGGKTEGGKDGSTKMENSGNSQKISSSCKPNYSSGNSSSPDLKGWTFTAASLGSIVRSNEAHVTGANTPVIASVRPNFSRTTITPPPNTVTPPNNTITSPNNTIQSIEDQTSDVTSTDVVSLDSSVIRKASMNSTPVYSSPSSYTFNFLNLPLDPSICTWRIIKSKCKFMVSSAAPMWLVFDNADPLGTASPTIFKSGDDLRQDILILQLLKLMESIWQRDGLELHVSAYGCVATGKDEGFIEVVPNSTTTGKIQKDFGASGAFRKTPLAAWIQQQHANDPEMHEEAIDNFVSSCAAYCVASYVLGLGDRHADNIMVTRMGHLFHIDFAHILGNIMMFGAYKRERAPFVLTPEFVFVMGDTKSPRYARFVDLCLTGYNSLRRHTYLFIRLFKLMINAGLPQFREVRDLAYLYRSLSLGLSEKGAAEKFSKLIDESRKTTTTLVNNFFHNLATGGGSSSNDKKTPKNSPTSRNTSTRSPVKKTPSPANIAKGSKTSATPK